MVGYKSDRYLYFGRVSARLDDAVNFLPARIAGLLMVLSAKIIGLDGKTAWRIFRRDRRNHASPNSAQTEAACAGALHVRLGGDARYFGKLVHKPTIGDADRPVEPEDIRRAQHLLIVSSSICLMLVILGKVLVIWL
jgi:adenosylcobinamide-phosphate synthase